MPSLTVGPILGAQTLTNAHYSQRIFVRGTTNLGLQTAWVRLRETGGEFSYVQSAELKENQDFTHVFEFQNLPPDSVFEISSCSVAGCSVDEPSWDALTHKFKTPALNVQVTAFTFGSCRSPDRGKDRLGDDRCFKVIADRHLDDDFVLMCGDQIYADFSLKGRPLIKHDERMTLEHFLSHYRKFFARPSFAEVVGSLPTYMIMDDHEVLNNWSQGAFERGEEGFENLQIRDDGLKAYALYQASLADAGGHDPASFHFEFSHGRCDFFMMDQRSQRDVERNTQNQNEYNLILDNQMCDLKSFISNGHDRIKFIVSPVPMLPDSRNSIFARVFDTHPEERWEGYPSQRGEILSAIHHEQVSGTNKNFVILSGDVHCSSLYQLRHQDDPAFNLYQVTSSAFNWTVFPGLNDINFARKKPLKGNPDYVPKRLGGRVLNQHNFCRIHVSDTLHVTFYDNRGKLLREKHLELR